MAERTRAQVHVQPSFDGTLVQASDYQQWTKTVREMRLDPTLQLARGMITAPVLAAEWSYEGDDEDQVEFIRSQMDPVKHHLMQHTILGWMDFGWHSFEKVFDFVDGKVVLTKLKPLLQDYTEINVDANGRITGITNEVEGNETELSTDEAFITYTDVEGTDWYGQAWMRAAEDPWNRWKETDTSARKYQQRVAGTHWVLYYPTGESEFEGELTDNFVIAKKIIDGLESNSKVLLPVAIDELIAQLNEGSSTNLKSVWELKLLSDDGNGSESFENRLKYLDALKVRALRLPERAVLEGVFGTKAEAESHADFAITNMEMRHLEAVLLVNWHIVNHLTRMNFGAENLVKIMPSPIADASRALLKDIYIKILSDPTGFLNEVGTLDIEAIKSALGIPSVDEEDIGDLIAGVAVSAG